MRRIILRMIAAGSLSAFSTAITQLPGGVRAPAGSAVQPARAQATQSPPQTQLLPQQGMAKPDGPPPSRSLPRGSLLDLSV